MTSILAPKTTLTRSQVLTMAIATGTTVANLYYSQPILGAMAATFGASSAQAGSVPLLAQAGFAIGLVFVAPLGDLQDRKRQFVPILSRGKPISVEGERARATKPTAEERKPP